jgi:hypothetical protein
VRCEMMKSEHGALVLLGWRSKPCPKRVSTKRSVLGLRNPPNVRLSWGLLGVPTARRTAGGGLWNIHHAHCWVRWLRQSRRFLRTLSLGPTRQQQSARQLGPSQMPLPGRRRCLRHRPARLGRSASTCRFVSYTCEIGSQRRRTQRQRQRRSL